MNGKKEMNALLREVVEQGFVVHDRGNHWQVRERRGHRLCTIHKTQSDTRSLHNTVAQLRRLGFCWQGR